MVASYARKALNDRGFKGSEKTSIEKRVKEEQVWEGHDFSRAACP
jgi:hypothetical protein